MLAKHRRLLFVAAAVALVTLNALHVWRSATCGAPNTYRSSGRTLVTFAYEEANQIQLENFEFFLRAGVSRHARLDTVSLIYVIAPGPCSPCALWGGSEPVGQELLDAGIIQIGHAEHKATALYRSEGAAADLTAYNVSIEYVRRTSKLSKFSYFIFLDSTARGPLFPHYMPPDWHWTDAFVAPLSARGAVRAVGASLVCLPVVDDDGPGPRLESWAFSVDLVGLRTLLEANVMATFKCNKPRGNCSGGGLELARGGEYAITATLLKAGHNVATLLSKYELGTDWHDLRNWHCNDNVHPSRASTYEGISMHPYETVFVRSSWRVSEDFTIRYSKWELQHLDGESGAGGQFDEAKYKYALSDAAKNPVVMGDGVEAAVQAKPWYETAR